MATVAEMGVRLTAQDDTKSVFDSVKGGLKDIGTTAAGFVVGGGLSQLPGKLLEMAQAAADDAASTGKLEQAITNIEGSFAPYSKAVDDAISKGQDLAFSDDEVRNSLAFLTTATGDADEAMNRLSLAQDLARGAGISLEAASKLLGKTSDENTATLKKYGIQVDENATAQDVLNEVDKRFGGQAAAFAEGDAAKMAIMADKVGELQEAIGYKLLPILSTLVGTAITVIDIVATGINPVFETAGTVISTAAGFIQSNAIPIIAAFAAGLIVLGVTAVPAVIAAATTLATVTIPQLIAQGIALAIAYAPITITILAVAAAAAALAYAWENNLLGIQDKVQAFGDWISPYISAIFGGIQKVFETVFPIIAGIVTTYIGIYQTVIQTAFDAIKTAYDTVFPPLQEAFTNWVNNFTIAFNTLWPPFKAALDAAMAAVQLVFDTVWPYIQTLTDAVWSTVSALVTTYIGIVRDAIGPALAIVQGAFDLVWPYISTLTDTTFQAIKGFVDTFFTPIVEIIGGNLDSIHTKFDTVLGLIKTLVETFWNGAAGVYTVSKNAIDTIKSTISTALDGMKTKWDTIWGGLSSAVGAAWGEIKGYINSIIGGLNALIGGWNNFSISSPGLEVLGQTVIPSFTFNTPNIPTIPLLAAGGIVTEPTLLVAGERGKEAIVPLDRMNEFTGGNHSTTIELWIDGKLLSTVVESELMKRQRVRVNLGTR